MAFNRALDYIEEHAREAPLIEDVCRAARTSWQTLDYAFREQFGMTPKQFLVARRLAGVRRELLRAAPGMSVREVAERWGFRHPRWLGAKYRAHFGELPSTTLRRRVE
jgi:AraC family ethanolamine operon transcriptional activator